MSKFTPGPWVVRHQEYSTKKVPLIMPEDIQKPYITEVPYRVNSLEEMEANAKLIAAAPDLLAALQAAVECRMVPISSAREGGASARWRHAAVADMIRDAIAKATGEA